MGNPYAADKGLWYGGRIEDLRSGSHPSPVHVQLILSDLCNQSCHFCLDGETRVRMADPALMPTPIKDVRVGDMILGPDREPVKVEAVSQRTVEYALLLTLTDGRMLVATDEHPVLTVGGWVPMGDIEPGQQVTVTSPPWAPEQVAERVASIRRVTGPLDVYNLSCPPIEAFIANGIVVHNCAYRMPGYTSSQLFSGDAEQIRFPINPNRQIPTEKALEIVDSCAQLGVEAIQLTGGGEPSIHPGICEVIGRIRDYGLKWSLVSNGYSWPDGLFDRVPSASWVRISVDSANPDSYAQIRQTPRTAFDRVLGNITRMRAEIDAAETATTLGFGFVVTPENHSEVYEAARLAKNSGAHNIRFSAMFSQDGMKPYEGIAKNVQAGIELARSDFEDDDFQIVGRFSLALANLRQARPDYERCAYQRFTTYIGGDLNVYVCCVYSYNEHGLIGSIRDRSFADFWRADETREFFEDFDARSCERCQFNDRNRALNAAIDAERPDHVEFV